MPDEPHRKPHRVEPCRTGLRPYEPIFALSPHGLGGKADHGRRLDYLSPDP